MNNRHIGCVNYLSFDNIARKCYIAYRVSLPLELNHNVMKIIKTILTILVLIVVLVLAMASIVVGKTVLEMI